MKRALPNAKSTGRMIGSIQRHACRQMHLRGNQSIRELVGLRQRLSSDWNHAGPRQELLSSNVIFGNTVIGKKSNRFSFSTKRLLSTEIDAEKPSNLKLYNTMTDSLEAIPTVDSTTANQASEDLTPQLGLGWYTCGPTTYAPAHLGHARTYVCLDILRRVMTAFQKTTSPEPLFVLNITDVDDKTLAAALEDGGSDPLQLARKYEQEFWRDWDALNCLRPHIVTRVTEHVDSHIVPFVQSLVDKGFAYELIEDTGDDNASGIYFDVRAYNEHMGHLTKYGKLAPPAAAQDMDNILLHNKTNDGGETLIGKPQDPSLPVQKKKDPRDFVLWKKREEGQEALSWSSPWGHGRPGWHIECSAMIEAVQERFRDSHKFLVHAGGIDLKFPHHTNEIAQSEAYLGTGDWIPHWVHTGHLHIDGLKMSKSLKNFVSIEDFLEGRVALGEEDDEISQTTTSALESPSDDFRLWCLGLSGSYRGPATFSMTRIGEARSVRYKFLRFLTEGEDWIRTAGLGGAKATSKKWDEDECDLFRTTNAAKRRGLSALENDLDGSAFVSELLAIADCGMKYMESEEKGPVEPLIHAVREVRELLRLVGFTKTTTEAGIVSESTDQSSGRVNEEALVDSLVQFRTKVRDIALQDPSAPGMSELLALSDELRDSGLPKIGVQLMDGNSEESNKAWKFCLPRLSPPKEESKSPVSSNSVDLLSIPLSEFFKVGQYEGVFSEYKEDGTPTHNADGSEVSKRSLKKLLKKREKHQARLEKNKLR